MQDKNPGKEFKVFFLISYYCSVMERVNRFMEMIKKLIASYINIRKHKDHFYSIDVVVIPIYSILKYWNMAFFYPVNQKIPASREHPIPRKTNKKTKKKLKKKINIFP